ncbi:DUF4124 domain-containing protein [Arenimonas daejeonensis]|uniref:DUF4124 domain-containing protein n=1 Tax=Arenimonas daejeonensis TaxID=370777 RepID=UPI0011BFAC6C|nr:DUF4124 domain-containing protein [Arenimonas daejeonensis]
MIRTLISIAVASTLLAAAVAGAQEKPKKLYRWVDKDGKVQFSDALPPEAVDQARTEINPESGMATASIERALTEEERIAKEKADAEKARIAKDEEQARMTEEAMIASFQTEEELKRSFQVRVDLMRQTLDAIEAGIGSQRASLTGLLAQASEAELAGRPVNAKQTGTIRELHSEMIKQQQMLVLKQGELEDLDAELARLIDRFREIKATKPDAAPTPAPDADAAQTPTG